MMIVHDYIKMARVMKLIAVHLSDPEVRTIEEVKKYIMKTKKKRKYKFFTLKK